MGRINYNEAKEYASKGGDFNFFALNDKECKRVRFLHHSLDDIEIYAVHQVRANDGKLKNVSCLRSINEPIQKCPLCASGNNPKARAYICLADENNQVYVWERSTQFLTELEGYFNRYGDLTQHIIEIERRGAKGDKNTKYNLYYIGQSQTNELPEVPTLLGRLVLDKDDNEMNTFLNTGAFPEVVNPDSNQMPQYERREVYNQPQQDVQTYAPYPQPNQSNNGFNNQNNNYNPQGNNRGGQSNRGGW